MTSLKDFFNQHEADMMKGVTHKNSLIKRNIIAYMALHGQCTLAELTKELHISVPTITKLVQELVQELVQAPVQEYFLLQALQLREFRLLSGQ